MKFDFDSKTRQELGYKVIDAINAYFTSLPERPVQLPAEQRAVDFASGAMPEDAADAAAVLDEVCRDLIANGFHTPAGNYFGLMNPAPTYLAVLAEALVAALNPQLANRARSPQTSSIEAETVRWIGERIGWEGPFDGTFTTGGTEANFSALALALSRQAPGIVENGIASAKAPLVFYASEEAHHSLDKAAGLLGIGRRALRRIPVNDRIQLDLDILERTIRQDMDEGRQPFALVATAGTTNSGAIDDLPALAAIARRHRLWLHVDGAYGAATVLSNRHRHLVSGIELADSITIDPHKWLAMPYSASLLLTTHPEMLPQTFGVTAPYLRRDSDEPDSFAVGFQWSRRMNSLKLWLTLRVHGRQAYEELIDRQLRLARAFAGWIAESEFFGLATPPALPVVVFRIKAPGLSEPELAELHAAIVGEVNAAGTHWISDTKVAGRSVIRMMVISYLSEERNLHSLQQALVGAVEKVRSAATSLSRRPRPAPVR